MPLPRLALNLFLATILLVVIIDTLPQAPPALHTAVKPLVELLAIHQGPWALFAPNPDKTNTRLLAEITYRDGEERIWHSLNWTNASAWDKWTKHRHLEWFDHVPNYKHARLYEAWSRHIAREARPDLASADQGAEVRIIVAQAEIPPASERPWKSFREPRPFDDRWVLTIEQLE
jgi:hypothetical protein